MKFHLFLTNDSQHSSSRTPLSPSKYNYFHCYMTWSWDLLLLYNFFLEFYDQSIDKSIYRCWKHYTNIFGISNLSLDFKPIIWFIYWWRVAKNINLPYANWSTSFEFWLIFSDFFTLLLTRNELLLLLLLLFLNEYRKWYYWRCNKLFFWLEITFLKISLLIIPFRRSNKVALAWLLHLEIQFQANIRSTSKVKPFLEFLKIDLLRPRNSVN